MMLTECLKGEDAKPDDDIETVVEKTHQCIADCIQTLGTVPTLEVILTEASAFFNSVQSLTVSQNPKGKARNGPITLTRDVEQAEKS